MDINYKLAMAAGRDAGNRHMKAAGRKRWNSTDYRIAARLVAKLLGAA